MPSHRDTARQFPWDRVPVVTGTTFLATAAIAVLGPNVLGTFTIPAGKAATIDNVSIAVQVAAAFAGARGFFYIDWTDGIIAAILASVTINGAVAGNTAYTNVGQSGWIRPGQQVRLLSNLAVAGATYDIQMGVKLTECQP